MKQIRDKSGNNPSLRIGEAKQVTTSSTIGKWVLFAAHSAGRNELSLQNRSSADLYFTNVDSGAAAPADGAVAAPTWELHVPADPAFFIFPTIPPGDIYVRSTAASSNIEYQDS